MIGVEYTLHRVHDAEHGVVDLLDEMIGRHQEDHEIYYGARDLRIWSAEHITALADRARDRGVRLDADTSGPGALHRAAVAAALTVRRPEPGIVLLEDLHDLYLAASHASLAWEMLAQLSQAQHDRELLRMTGSCHPQTLRQIRWANTMLKTLSPQTLSSL